MIQKICCAALGLSVLAGMQFSAAPAKAMSKEEAKKECVAMYGGRANYIRNTQTGMSVRQCIAQKTGGGGKSEKKK